MNEKDNHILNLFAAYSAKKITQKEFNTLRKWLNQSEENKQQFSDYLQFYKRIRRIGFLETIDKNKAWSSVVSQLELPLINPVEKARKTRKSYYRYAAVASVLIILGLTIFLNKENNTQFTEPVIVNTIIEPGTDKATLTLEDGSQIALEKGASFQTQNANSNGEEIIYESEESKTTEVAYNYLAIPRGGQFFIKLSDGTQVWLNSESQLKYPVNFVRGKTRQVELVYGEAYFDVSPSTEHNGSKFEVFNNAQLVEVVGTEFNIKAYKDETNVYTTLVEGKVNVNIENRKQSLKPSQQLNLDLSVNLSTIKTVDVYNEVSWKDGVFSFEEKTLRDMMKVLSRWYDVDIIFKNKEIENEIFDGVLRKNQNLDQILEGIKNFKIVKKYEIKEKEVILE